MLPLNQWETTVSGLLAYLIDPQKVYVKRMQAFCKAIGQQKSPLDGGLF
jgi:hypothetical protein